MGTARRDPAGLCGGGVTVAGPFSTARPPTLLDHLLIVGFLLGIYLDVAVHLPGGVPVPAILAGATGGLLLLKHAGRISERQVLALVGVVVVLLLSTLTAPDYGYLRERFKGVIQFAYSLTIGYGFFIAAAQYDRDRLARPFLWFCLVIVAGCALENFVPAVRNLSDGFRSVAFSSSNVYSADLRDQILYGRIRPKLFTSEPSAVTFAYTLFAFVWYVLSTARWKLFGFLGFLTAGYLLMRGPSLLLGFATIPLYEILLAPRRGPPENVRYDTAAIMRSTTAAAFLAVGGVFAAATLYQERIADILSGQDPSFFSRIIAPALTAFKVVAEHPVSGAGLTGWEYIETIVQQIYAASDALSTDYYFDNAATALTNFFWLHWIFLGLFWGVVLLLALSFFLRALGAPSLLFCWTVWAVFGQSSGGYVDPRTWIVLILACAASVIADRDARMADAMRLRSFWGRTPAAAPAPPQGSQPELTLGTS